MTSLELFRALILAMPDPPVTDAIVNQFVTTASCRLCAEAYGVKFAEASVWYAAHLISQSGILQGGSSTIPAGGGTITSLKTGDESIGFSAPAAAAAAGGTDSDLMMTHYGRQFIFLRDTRPASTPTVITIC